MPFIYEQKPTFAQPRNPRRSSAIPCNSSRPSDVPRKPQILSAIPRNSQGLSTIPRLEKQPVAYSKPSGISHASRPTRATPPIPTPSKEPNRTRLLAHNDQSQALTLDSEAELAILDLVPFSSQTFVEFGDVKPETTKVRYVVIRNSRPEQQQLIVKSMPKKDKGFYMDATEFIIAPHVEICVTLAWTPKIPGGCRESITLQDAKRMSWKIVLMGNAVSPKQAPSVSRPSRNVPRVFRRSPPKINRQLRQESKRALFSPKATTIKSRKLEKPLIKLSDQSPERRHQLVRKILSQHDEQKAIKVQSYCRMILERRRLEREKAARSAVVTIQCYVRRFIAQRRCEKLRSALVLQKHFRGLIVRREYLAKRRAAITLQKQVRMLIERRRYKKLRSAIVIQKYFRGLVVRREYQAKRTAAIMIQRQVRMFLERRCKEHRSALVIQRCFRGFMVRRDYRAKKSAAIVFQKQFRMLMERRRYEKLRSAIVIQKYFRGLTARREAQAKKRAIVLIQKQVRMLITRRLEKQRCAIVIQKHFRGFVVRREFQATRKASILVQKQVRMLIVRRRYLKTIEAMSVLLDNFRCLTGRSCTLSFHD